MTETEKNIKIPLSKQMVAIIDESDHKLVSQYKWYANKMSNGKYRAITNDKTCPYLYMHQLIMQARGIDHINRDPLDNRRSNLRVCSHKNNCRNTGKKGKNPTSKYKGVCFENWSKRWLVQIKVNYKRIYLGRYSTEEEAAKAYDQAALQYFGNFANLNFKA